MSHEIRTPMTAILGYADLLRETGGGMTDQQRAEALETIHDNGQYLLQLINDILDLSKIEAGQTHLERVRYELGPLATDVEQLMRRRANEKGLELRLRRGAADPGRVWGDRRA